MKKLIEEIQFEAFTSNPVVKELFNTKFNELVESSTEDLYCSSFPADRIDVYGSVYPWDLSGWLVEGVHDFTQRLVIQSIRSEIIIDGNYSRELLLTSDNPIGLIFRHFFRLPSGVLDLETIYHFNVPRFTSRNKAPLPWLWYVS